MALIEDDSALRSSIKDAWLTETPARVLSNKPFVKALPGGGPVQVRIERQGSEFTVILARRWNGTFPGWGQGSWMLTRNEAGEYRRLRIFLQSDPNTYIQFRPMDGAPVSGSQQAPQEGKTWFDLVLYEAYVIRGLAVGLSFDQLLTMPLGDLFDALGNRFPARYFNPDPGRYRDTRALLAKVRARVPPLNYVEDGALDENGRYVFINSLSLQNETGERGGLNCSGFTKWLVDGMLYPLMGRRLSIPPLKTPTEKRTSSLSENYAARDPWFGLDWTRNLALEAVKILRSPSMGLEEVEVRKGTFAALIDRSHGVSVRNYPVYLPNAGFGVEGLKPLLYTLAVNEPGYLYLASVNAERGPAPRMRSHYHEAVLVPYFNEYGVFQTAVFESAEETSLNAFIGRHYGKMVNLVRIPVEGNFAPD